MRSFHVGLKASVALTLLPCAAAAQSQNLPTPQGMPAQDPDQPAESEAGEVVVTGIRQSLAAGIDVKRKSDQIVDSIVAEDIGKLPDQNVAESLSRVSGVQVRRGIDEASDISIRGLRQNRLEFNGRTLISPYGRGPAGPDDGAYNVLTLIPSELVQRLDVTKLAAASETEGSLGGTVNILTRRPARDGLFIGGSFDAVYKDKADKMSYRGTALITNSFMDGKLGVGLGVTYQELNIRQDSFDSNSGWQPLDSRFNSNPSGVKFDPNGNGVPGFYIADLRYQRLTEKRRKLGVTGTVNWRPSDDFELYVDGLYAKADTDRRRNWLALPLSPTGSAYDSVVLSADENLVAGVIRQPIQGNTEYFDLPTNIYSGAIGGSWNATQQLKLSGEYSYTKADQDYIQTFIRNQTTASVPVGFDFRNGDVPSITLPAAVDLTNPAQQVFTSTFDNLFRYRSREVAGRFDAEYTINNGAFRSFKGGFRYNKITTERSNFRGTTTLARLPVQNYPNSFEILDVGDLLDGASGSFPTGYVAGLPFGAGTDFACQAFVTCTPQTFDPTTSYRLEEPVYAGYVQANIDSTVAGLPITGNFGMRYVRSEVKATGVLRVNNTTSQPRVIDVKYEDWLPSMALKLTVAPDLLLRFGAAKVIARPNTTDLTPALSVNELLATATSGNPELQPFRVGQVDASIEWYGGPGALVSLALFYKDVETFIITRQVRERIPGFTPDPIAAPDGLFRITRQINGEGGKIKGLEFQVQQPFTFLPAPFDGFGVNATYSYIKSTTPFTNSRDGKALPLEALSKHNVNLVGFYEKGPFGVRVAYNWRDKFLDRIGTGGDGVFFKGFSALSASLRYKVTEGIDLSLEGSNLTNSPVRKYGGTPEATANYALNGRTFTAGIRARF